MGDTVVENEKMESMICADETDFIAGKETDFNAGKETDFIAGKETRPESGSDCDGEIAVIAPEDEEISDRAAVANETEKEPYVNGENGDLKIEAVIKGEELKIDCTQKNGFATEPNNGPKKITMSTSVESDAVRAAYDDVRADNSETQWSVFKFDGSRIICSAKGKDFEEFRSNFNENERAFGYIRIQTGDEMSKRQKFLFVTWIGPEVSVLQRAKMSTDKSVIKSIISNFAVELQLESLSEFDLTHFIESLNRASGANYGTGVREI